MLAISMHEHAMRSARERAMRSFHRGEGGRGEGGRGEGGRGGGRGGGREGVGKRRSSEVHLHVTV